jgi:hypothetical protein
LVVDKTYKEKLLIKIKQTKTTSLEDARVGSSAVGAWDLRGTFKGGLLISLCISTMIRTKGMLRSFFEALGNEGNTDFEICLDCSMQNLDAFGAEDFVWRVLRRGEGVQRTKI